MDKFVYKKQAGITALSASFTNFEYKKHSHREYAIGVTLRGIQQYNLDGFPQLSHQNGVMFFNPDQAHDGSAGNKAGIDYVILYIEPKLFLEILGKKDIVHFSSPVIYDHKLRQRVINLSQAILNQEEDALCSELLLSLTENLPQPDFFRPGKKDSILIKKAKDMIHDNLEEILKLEDVSKELNISKYQLIRIFKKTTGISPYQYFLIHKVELAKQIIEKYKDVYLAVAECGFVDLTHLNKHFKSIYGLTAFQYLACVQK